MCDKHLDRVTAKLSGGWAQRLALAAAVIHQPKLLFFDEPTAEVDPISRREFWNLLYDLAQAETTIFVTTHDMDEAEHCQRIAFIYYGSLIANCAPHDIIAESDPGVILSFELPDPLAAEQALKQAISARTLPADSVSLFGAAIHVATRDTEHTRQAVQQVLLERGISQNSWRTIQPSLEDACIALVNRQA